MSAGRLLPSSGSRALVALCCAWLAFEAADCCADEPADTYRLAVGFYRKEEWKLAAENFETFLTANPRHPSAESARFYYGLSLVKLDDFRKARDVLRAYAKEYPRAKNAIASRYWAGHCSFHLNDYAEAERELTDFVKLAPDDKLREWALPYLADAELRQNKAGAALRHFKAALDAFPQGALADDAKFGLARSHEQLKQNDQALALYRELARDKTNVHAAEAQLNLGGILFDSRQYAEAAAAYEVFGRQFAESPQAPLAQLNLGFARYQLGEYRQAVAGFDQASRSEKYAPDALLWRGLCRKAEGEIAEALQTFQSAFEKYRDHPAAEKLLFQWADCEQRQGQPEAAAKLFLEVVSRWPKGTLADESLHRACLVAVNGDRLQEADTLLARFDREFPDNKLRYRQEILKARVLAAKNDLPGAERRLKAVIAESDFDSTRQQARYYLADVAQKQNRHTQVLEITEPLAALWKKREAGPADLAGVFVLRAASLLALAREAAAKEQPQGETSDRLARCAAADEAAAQYLKVTADGPLAARAKGIRTIAAALTGDKTQAGEALQQLRQPPTSSAELKQTLYDLGTIAFARQDYVWSEALFGEVAAGPARENPLHGRAIADLGWSQYRQKKFPESATTFERLVREHPGDALVPEAAFMRGSSLQEAGRLPEAQAAFAQAFALPGDSNHTFLAGLQAARLLVKLQRIQEADAIYTDLLKRFGQRNDADKVVDEWATVHYNAEDYEKADALFRRLARDYPNSALANNARLSLAESDLIAGRFDEARAQFEKFAARTQPDQTLQQRSLYQLMQIEFETKRWDALRQVCRDSLARFPEGDYRRDAEWKWAEADFHAGDLKSALARLQRLKDLKDEPAVRKAGWFGQMWALLAETELRLKDHEAVAGTVAEFRALDPENAQLCQADEVLGRSLKAQARWDEARTAFKRAIQKQGPPGKRTATGAKCQFLIADSYHYEKKYDEAYREYQTVDILYDEFPEWQAPALHAAGLCLENLGRWKEALATYEDLLRRFPDSEVAGKARERLDQARKRVRS